MQEIKSDKAHSEESLQFWLQHIESFHPAEIKLGLDRIKQVAERLGVLKKQSKLVIVGGTNGKGSCVAMLESLCLNNNKTVGCYTSPHLLAFNERIRLNGKQVSDNVLVKAFKAIEQHRQDIALTFFEFTTLAALLIFQQQKLDLVVLEVGLGGRQDATNIIEPDVSVITTIDIDHTDWLSNDIDRIAYEKAGIMRLDKATFVGDKKSFDLLQKVVPEFCELAQVVESAGEDLAKALSCEENNQYQLLTQNLLLARAAFEKVFATLLDKENFLYSLRSIRINGRFQLINISPTTIVDVGHNAQAAGNLASQLRRFIADHEISRVTAICGMMSDKAVEDVLAFLEPLVDQWSFVELDTPRAISCDELLRLHQESGSKKIAETFTSVAEAFDSIKTNAKKQEMVLVFGSFITVANMLRFANSKLSN